MKKRILALALAGTTAFSVFGAMSVNAATIDIGSAHVVSTNDMYKHYAPVATAITADYTAGTSDIVYVDENPGDNAGENFKIDADYASITEYIQQNYNVRENYEGYKVYVYKDTTAGKKNLTLWDDSTQTFDKPNSERLELIGITSATDAYGLPGYMYDEHMYPTLEGAINAAGYKAAETDFQKYYNITTMTDLTETQWKSLNTVSYYSGNIKAITTSIGPATGTINVDPNKADRSEYTWTFDGSTSSDTTIYPWTTETYYPKDENGKYLTSEAVNEAVETPTVYLFDFLPANTVYASSSAVASAYNAYVTAAKKYDIVNASATATAEEIAAAKKAMDDALAAAAKLMDTSVAAWTAEKGDGGSYGIRAEVVDEYENFLSELVLLQRYGDYTVSKTDFKNEYKDLYVTGYLYNPLTGLATNLKWSTDLYNMDELLDDIYESSKPSTTGGYAYNYLNMNTSELMYLMQQYDKYVGYIEKEEVSNDEWGDLLVSILENVAEDDFKKTADYKTFARKAEDAIDAYNYAETSSMINAAERAMYELIISSQSKSSGAADAKADLDATVDSLYFNAKATPTEYLTKGISKGNAALTNFAYIAAVTVDEKVSATDDITLTETAKTTTGYYSLYPAADYKQNGNTAAQFAGNDTHGTAGTTYVANVTDEYEWFLNVYELAAAVNSVADAKAVSGVVTAVNDALDAAVADLAVTVSAPTSYTAALDEALEDYEDALDFYVTGNGVNEEDFNETYYAAYEQALEIAANAEGATQVAHARYMVSVAGEALTYQGAQATVTKNMIGDVEDAIDAGETALNAIKNSDDYNAAQVTALNKAIAQAQDIVDIYNGTYSSSYNKVNKAKRSGVGDKDGIVISDTTGAIEAIDAAINYSEIVMGWSQNDADKWMYGTEEGYLNDGWHQVDGGKTWFYFNADGTAKQSEWWNDNGTWYWFNSNCGAATGWAKVDGEWYFFKGNNAMKTGWEKVDGNWYYMASSGKMVTGWCEVNGKWYYFSKASNSLGQMLYSTTVDGYKLGADGAWIK